MAQNITLMGANYEDVPSVTLPRTGGGTASFVDIGDTTASASDVLEGKVMYTASGIRTIGTGAIGGGVPSGGITNEVLTKVSSTDYDVTWSSIPVQSVNNKTGAVNLSASDVGALPQNTAIPSCAADVGALPSNTFIPSVASDVGAIPAPASASSDNVLAYNGSAWVADKRTVILSYGHSTWAEFLSAYNANAVIYCRASSNSNPATGSQTRMAFMAYVNNADNPTNVEFQYYRSVNTHSATQQGDQMYVYKLDKTAGWTVTVRENYTKINVGTGLASSYSNSALTITNPAAVPTGGTTGQALVKTSSTNYALAWQTIDAGHGLPSGGEPGQILKKATSSDYATEWGNIPVQSVNNQTGAVVLTAEDVGALSSNIAIPSAVSDLVNDLGFITTETDPTVPSWAKAADKPSYTAAEVGAIAAPSAPMTGDFLVYTNNGWDAETVTMLPTVTSADNGKVLRVVNGVWAAASLPSASGVSF